MNQNDIILADDINTSLNNLQTQIQGLKLTKVWETPYPPQAGEFPPQTITINEVVPEFIIYYKYKANGYDTGFCHGKALYPDSGPNKNNISIAWTEFNSSTNLLKLNAVTRAYYVNVQNGVNTTFQFLTSSHFIAIHNVSNNTTTFSGGETDSIILPLEIYKVEDIYNS